ncbi:hypothetical protein BGZ49_004833 [Haplosporangium sp. Z 27]|nr:hypothetical protein BGZ49_004833 [Haplosporangium sp. Z 27]
MVPNFSTEVINTDKHNLHSPKAFESIAIRLHNLASEDRLKVTHLKVLASISFNSHLVPLLNATASVLTNLELKDTLIVSIPIDQILILCPLLISLAVQETNTVRTNLQGDKLLNIKPQAPTHRLQLQSLNLDSIHIEIATLMWVMEFSPTLKELRLKDLQFELSNYSAAGFPSDDSDSGSEFEKWLYRQIASYCPNLEMVYVLNSSGIFEEAETIDNTRHVLESLPWVTRWGFQSRDLSPAVFTLLWSYRPNLITYLEIDSVSYIVLEGLHTFLCESPQLLHLKARNIGIDISWLDIEGILDYMGQSHRKAYFYDNDSYRIEAVGEFFVGKLNTQYPRRIWACRNLQTLHLAVDYRPRMIRGEEHERILFGYISKVCPRLQDLIITPKLFHKIETGFCLLARLQELRRLEIMVDHQIWHHSQFHLDWISKNMTPSLKIKMVSWIAKLRFMEQSKIYAKTPFLSTNAHKPTNMEMDKWTKFREKTSQTTGKGHTESTPDHIVDGVDMRNLGRLTDVANHLQDRLLHNQPCWPHLEFLKLTRVEEYGDIRKAHEQIIRVFKKEYPGIVDETLNIDKFDYN